MVILLFEKYLFIVRMVVDEKKKNHKKNKVKPTQILMLFQVLNLN